ncbi:MAG: PD-(D/E)XK nuclease family protein [Oscillospiraceae bacterium]|jgi:ATP-dependent helicase/nuclease subunit B|nr:PD-(D/E)XK nuclease family protein [Oscillospiraceae bacterium]
MSKTTVYTGRPWRLPPLVFDEIGALLPSGKPLILLVPEQSTLQTELDVVRRLNLRGFITLHVLSPSRLSDRVFEQTGSPRSSMISASGKSMALAAILQSVSNKLVYYGKAARLTGFAKKAVEIIGELKRAGLVPNDCVRLAQTLGRTDNPDKRLQDKLNDISIIWERYEEFLAEQFVDGEDVQSELIRRLPESTIFDGAHVWAMGFDLVTPQFASLIISVAAKAESLTLALISGSEADLDAPLWEPARATLARLAKWFDLAGIEWEHKHIGSPLARPAEILAIESGLFSRASASLSTPDAPHSAFDIIPAPNMEAQTEWAAARILTLCKNGVKPDEIIVLHTDLGGSARMTKNILGKYGIPIYLDEKKKAQNHPLFRSILAALRFALHGEATFDLLEWLGFSSTFEEDVFTLGKFAHTHAIDGDRWRYPLNASKSGKPFGEKEQKLRDKAESIRETAVKPLYTLQRRLRASRANHAAILWDFTVECAYAERMNELVERIGLGEGGVDASQAEDAKAAWGIWLSILDQLAALESTSSVPHSALLKIIESGLESTELATLPPETGRVTVGQLGRTKLGLTGTKAIILLGAQNASSSRAGAGLLSDAEVAAADEALQNRKNRCGAAILASTIKGLDDKSLLNLYRMNLLEALSAPSEYLAVTCTVADDQHLRGGKLPPLVSRMNRLTGGAIRPYDTIDGLPVFMYARYPILEKEAQSAEPPQFARDRVISEAISQALYSGKKYSVTRLESYASCGFRHFVRFGLAPRNEDPPEVLPTPTGIMAHLLMQKLAELLVNNTDAANLSDAQAEQLIRAITEPMLSEYAFGILDTNAKTRSIRASLARLLDDSGKAMLAHARGSSFRTITPEQKFSVALNEERASVTLEGTIDRIDAFTNQAGEKFFRVVDYKYGKQAEHMNFNPTKLIMGLSLQLPLYLFAARSSIVQNGIPAAALYFKMVEPLLELSDSEEKMKQSRADSFILRGIVVDRKDVAFEMDNGASVRSLPTLYKKDGERYKNAQLLSLNEMDALIDWSVRKAMSIADSINRGDISAKPAATSQYMACNFCGYRALCGRDENIPYMVRDKVSFDEMLKKIKFDSHPS